MSAGNAAHPSRAQPARRDRFARVRAGQTLSSIAHAHHCTIGELRAINHLDDVVHLPPGARIRLPMPAARKVRRRKRTWGKAEQPGRVTFVGPDGPQKVRLVDADGLVPMHGLLALQRLMSRERSDATQEVHPRLALLLASISDHFGGRTIRIVSGLRAVRRFTLPTSRHTMGRATDIQVLGVPRRQVWNYCRSLLHTGCGFYPHSVFVHVDVRRDNAQWVDWSRPGKRPRYGTLRRPYRQKECRSPTRPRIYRSVSRPDAVPLTVRVVDASGALVRLVDEQPGAQALAAIANELLHNLLQPVLATTPSSTAHVPATASARSARADNGRTAPQ